jgi:PAS domain-containing protein
MAISPPHAGRRPQTPDEPAAQLEGVEFCPSLRETLNALLEFTGATAGWIGLLRPDGRLYFPARAGTFSEAWLKLQQGQTSIWGFAVGEGPTLVNDPPPLPILGDPPLRNLATCLLRRGAEPAGQLVLANKSNGFTSQDTMLLQTMAHLLSRQLVREEETTRQSLSVALLRQALDQLPEGVLIVDHKGNLLFANATWGQWTGYATEELCDRLPPFPFWVSDAELAALGELERASLADAFLSSESTGMPSIPGAESRRNLLPFRHRNHSLFWCQMETTSLEVCGLAVTIAFLRQVPIAPWSAHRERASTSPRTASALREAIVPDPHSSQTVDESLPFLLTARGTVHFRETKGMALLLRPGGSIELWDKRWEELTGLTRQDLAGVSAELFLDWLFPRQRDRSFVADLFHQPGRRGVQALLEVAGRSGNCPLLCTFLPVRASDLEAEALAIGKGILSPVTDARSSVSDAWLILACAPEVTATEESRVQRFVQRITRGLSR